VRAGGADVADRDRLRRAGPGLDALVGSIERPTAETLPFVTAWQQLTGPVTAKGVEDTALYVDTSFVARNEPGCTPDRPSTDVEEFHRACAERAGTHPLNATSTHDTKRSEDVRMRISALSELAGEWEHGFERWRELNRPLRRRPDTAPDAAEEWLLYQTLVGAWPIGADRIGAYMLKAIREANVHTGWIEPDEGYESDLLAFVEAILASAEFVADIGALAARCADIGAASSIALLVLKLAAPGVPDIYWGNEDWDLSLVDPDNRRPVDFADHARRLAAVKHGRVGAGHLKVLVTWRGLELRRREAEVFADGAYVPIETTGAHAGNVVAFARVLRERWVIVAVPHLTAALHGWDDTRLRLPDGAPRRFEHVFTGETLTAADLTAEALFAALPAALLRTHP
jgi:(1->4)-alpha-D-glucan 1-alpha-D-glucosylmutase